MLFVLAFYFIGNVICSKFFFTLCDSIRNTLDKFKRKCNTVFYGCKLIISCYGIFLAVCKYSSEIVALLDLKCFIICAEALFVCCKCLAKVCYKLIVGLCALIKNRESLLCACGKILLLCKHKLAVIINYCISLA